MSQPKPMFTGMMGSKTPNFINSNKKKTSFFGGLFGGSKNNNKNFIKANKFNKAKPGFAFKTGNEGLGYYKNDGGGVPFPGGQGPITKPNTKNTGTGNNVVNNVVNKPNTKNMGIGNNIINNNAKPNTKNTGTGNNSVVNTNNNVPLNFAIGKIKGLGLKSEKKFINKLNFGGIKRKNIITEAERVSEKEREFLSFLDDLNISKTQLNGLIIYLKK